MIEKTNFQMLRELNNNFVPKEEGFIDENEVAEIEKTLKIKERDILNLRNLRDFTVMFYGKREGQDVSEVVMNTDRMSAIVAVIDDRLWRLGAEV